MNDLTVMLKIFAESKEDFTKIKKSTYTTSYTVIEFINRGITMQFDDKGKFEHITKNI